MGEGVKLLARDYGAVFLFLEFFFPSLGQSSASVLHLLVYGRDGVH